MLYIQELLRTGIDPEILTKDPYFLSVKRHPDYPELYQFVYNMIDSPKGDPLVNQCRGLILNSKDNWKIIAYPFNRFFNYGEFQADSIDWNSARVQEKVDGTLIIMYFYDGEWQIATRGSPDASGPVGDFPWIEDGVSVPLIFSRLFWNSCEHCMQGLSITGKFNINYTYLWELTSPYNRIVCDYTKTEMLESINELVDVTGYANDGSRITLIGIRNNFTEQELNLIQERTDVRYVVKEFPLTNLEEVIQAASKLNPLKMEGYVVVDKNFYRIKIKSPAYIAIHHIRDGNPRKRLMEIIQAGESDEMLSYKILDEWPAEKAMYLEMKEKVDKLVLTAELFYDTIKDIEIQKDFALKAVENQLSGVLFSLRKEKIKSIRQGVLGMPTDKLLEIVDKI
jgi:hypothetical protein